MAESKNIDKAADIGKLSDKQLEEALAPLGLPVDGSKQEKHDRLKRYLEDVERQNISTAVAGAEVQLAEDVPSALGHRSNDKFGLRYLDAGTKVEIKEQGWVGTGFVFAAADLDDLRKLLNQK